MTLLNTNPLNSGPLNSGPPGTALALFEAALVAQLKGDDAVDQLVAGRVYPLVIPQGKATPAIVYAIGSNERVRGLSGPSGVATATVHLDARSVAYGDCKAIQECLRQYDGFRGSLGGICPVLFTLLDDQADAYEWPDDGSGQGTQHLMLTFKFKYRETLPVQPAV